MSICSSNKDHLYRFFLKRIASAQAGLGARAASIPNDAIRLLADYNLGYALGEIKPLGPGELMELFSPGPPPLPGRPAFADIYAGRLLSRAFEENGVQIERRWPLLYRREIRLASSLLLNVSDAGCDWTLERPMEAYVRLGGFFEECYRILLFSSKGLNASSF